MKKARQIAPRMSPHIINCMADKLLLLLEKNEVFVEPDNDLRRNMHMSFPGDTIFLRNPAAMLAETLRKVTCTQRQLVTNENIRDLIEDARACAEVLLEILNLAARAAKKEPYISRKQAGLIFKTGRFHATPPTNRIHKARIAMKTALRIGSSN